MYQNADKPLKLQPQQLMLYSFFICLNDLEASVFFVRSYDMGNSENADQTAPLGQDNPSL